MNTMMMLVLLVQAGICAPTKFTGPDGRGLTVIVCPMLLPAPAKEEEGDPT